jgi:TonB family protein
MEWGAIMRLLVAASALLVSAGSAEAQSWRYEAIRDPFTDAITSRASATSRTQSVNVRCKDDRLEVYFWAAGYFGDSATVRYRFDSGEVRSGTWDTSTSGTGAFVTAPGEFARKLMSGSVLNIELEGEYGAASQYRFRLAGSGGPVGRVLDACGVPRHETYVDGGPIWRRAVEDLETVSREDVEAVGRVLKQGGMYDGTPSRQRTRDLYLALSDFYVAYWSLCEEGEALSESCRTWTARRRLDPEADYPKEPIALLVEVTQQEAPPGASAGAPASAISWSRYPAVEFPERAAARGATEGSVILSCTTQANGSLSACEIKSEEPAGLGFGQAALAGAQRARVSPRYIDSVGPGVIEVPMRFRVGSEAPD